MTLQRRVPEIVCLGILVAGLVACSSFASPIPAASATPASLPSDTPTTAPTETPTATLAATTLEYRNDEYGFIFTLPASWQGYSIVTQTWEGYAPGPSGDTPVEKGPLVLIRHPDWTAAVPRQDIPILVFTLAQWDALAQETFHIGAAPIGPLELGRNAHYVFALPARYNYAFPAGYEEVDRILAGHPLHAF